MATSSKEAQQKFHNSHKQFKVYLSTEDDMELIKWLMSSKNMSNLIRSALKAYWAQESAHEPKEYLDLYAKYGDLGGTTSV